MTTLANPSYSTWPKISFITKGDRKIFRDINKMKYMSRKQTLQKILKAVQRTEERSSYFQVARERV